MKKLNSFILPDIIIDKMEKQIENTRTKKIEHGFDLCLTKSNILTTGETCTGTECELVKMPKCEIGQFIGGFHTHPKTTAYPSILDMVYLYKHSTECIGSVKENKIRCFMRIGPRIDKEEKTIRRLYEDVSIPLDKKLKTGKATTKDAKRWINIRDHLLDKYFKTIDIK